MSGIILCGLIATGILFAIAIGWMVELLGQVQKLIDARDGDRLDV